MPSLSTPSTSSTPAIKSPLGGGGVGIKKTPTPEIKNESAVDGQPFAPVDFDASSGSTPERKDLVEASRVFRADEDSEKESAGVGRRVLYSILGIVLIFGGGYVVVLLEIIPGVSPSSVLNLFGASQEVTFQRQGAVVPALAVAHSEDQVVALPLPKIDVQAEVDFANLQANEEDLLTESGRREYAEKIAIIAGIISAEDVSGAQAEAEALPDLFDIEGGDGEQGGESYDDVADVKTAKLSRLQKARIDSRTPYDRLLSDNIKIHRVDGTESKVSDSPVTKIAEGGDGGETTGDSASQKATDSASQKVTSTKKSVKKAAAVKPSASGKERARKLAVARAFYARGSYAAAESEYRALVQKYPKNLEALRGLALVAVVTGRYQLALSQYVKILRYYPKDAVAIADLANLRGTNGGNVYELEASLRGALGQVPAANGRLYFALGNLYAGQGRWAEAQKSYFEAYSGDSANPDYAYNLAVVLDYLNKPAQAGVFYQRALELAQRSPSGFDASTAAERIRQLGK